MDRPSIASLILATPLLLAAAAPTGVPEIIALMPSGIYTGHAIQAGKRLTLTINVEESKPGGRFTGTVHVQAPAPCARPFPMIGTMKANGAVHIDSRAGVTNPCEKTFVLNLAGDDLKGTMLASEGTYQVMLKRKEQ